VRIGFAVEDLHDAVAELRSNGIEPVLEPREFNPCFVAAVRDPFGNLIMLHQRKDGTAG
jgi:predicted enzyme related to lactoylglutathione lyase